ncbi:MAG: NAD(P)/FAD-dependent oxidoreductase [Geminicoccaceae bacterium]|nr:NAD(P)/FAD-dependent oxidoreductase [Geminicoccaceae bacterium]
MAKRDYDVVVVGAGFAGMYMLHRLRGQGVRVGVLEAGSDVGGTWYWNRYPGARCDIESMQYSYQFSDALQQEWDWSERYAAQPEILRYAGHVADRFDLRRDISFDTRVVAAHFDEADGRWLITTAQGEQLRATFCVMATGCLSAPNLPPFEGRDSFDGPTFQTSLWPHAGVDFSGRRVAVIGTGSSAVQSIPIIARQASHLYVFQRTANYSIPARNRSLDPETVGAIKADYAGLRSRAWRTLTGVAFDYRDQAAFEVSPDEREREYEARWQQGGLGFMAAFRDLLLSHDANRTAAEFVRAKIRAEVRDSEVADKLSPRNVIGAKRLCIDTGYYATYNRPNVTLIDVSERPIERIVPEGVRAHGQTFAVDTIVYATGFDAMTGTLLRIDIRGRDGLGLADAWAGGPRSYLGLQTAGFPNLFTITGPGSPSVLTNMLPSIEHHVDWIAACLGHLRERGLSRIEASEAAERSWMTHAQEAADATIKGTTGSWYIGANVAGKPRVFMPYIGGVPAYLQKCDEVVRGGYAGFQLS